MAQVYTFDEEVVLLGVTETVNDIGDTEQVETARVSYAEIMSPYMKETYEALARGLKPEFVVVLPSWYDDYHGERQLEYNGEVYNIIRAYKAKDLTCELTVTKLKAKVSDLDTLASGAFGGVL